jgi:hypothetical protein
MSSFLSRWIKQENPPTPKPGVPASQGIRDLRTAVAANDLGGNVVQIIPRSAGDELKKLVGNVFLLGALLTANNDNNNERPIGVAEITNPAQILEAPMPDNYTVSPEAVVPTRQESLVPIAREKITALPEGVKITGENLSVKGFLPEIFKLLRLGKDLELLLATRKEKADKSSKARERARLAIEEATNIQTNISQFLGSNDINQSRDSLSAALNSYGNFLSAFTSEKNEEDSLLRKGDNELILRINGLKSEIAGMVQEVGGMDNFERIKSLFRKINFMRSEAGGYEQKVLAEAHGILERENNPVQAKILKSFAGTGDIINIFKFMYAANDNQK